MTTLYLIRHSVRIPYNRIEVYNTVQNDIIRREKICLSPLGEKRAEILAGKQELANMDVVYTSNCVRTIQTAKYLLENQHLNFSIDDRFDERRVGKSNEDLVKNWRVLQYTDENYKTEGGESQLDVRNRVTEAVNEVLEKNKGKRIAIYTHGYAITFYLMNFCKLLETEALSNGNRIKLEFNNEIIIDRPINAPEVFKLVFDDDNIIQSIKVIEFDDLEYMNGV